MNQRTHAWLATRAVALLEDSGQADGLVSLLAPSVKTVAIGAWLPDLGDSKKGFGDLDNHVLKMEPYTGKLKSRFVVGKNTLIKKLGPERKMSTFIKSPQLDPDWWKTSFKADTPPGQHLANRAMAFSTNLEDFLILGDSKIDELLPGKISFIDEVDPQARTRKQQAATYFFILSHFIADACMPCHCDGRKLSSYKKKKLHERLEAHWSKGVTTYFDKNKIKANNHSSTALIKKSREISDNFGITFNNIVPDLVNKDVWSEMIYICRASYAVANIMAPYTTYPFDTAKRPDLNKLYPDPDNNAELKEVDKVLLHDAVLNIAIVWKHIWDKIA